MTLFMAALAGFIAAALIFIIVALWAELNKLDDRVRELERRRSKKRHTKSTNAGIEDALANAIHLTFTADELSLRVQQLNDVLGRLRSGGPYGYESQPSNRFEKEKNDD